MNFMLLYFQLVYWEKDYGVHKGRHFIRRFDLENLDSLDVVAPEDAANFVDWPRFYLPRRLIMHDVPSLKLPPSKLFGGPSFMCNVRLIGDALREGLLLLGTECKLTLGF
jgi:hypothetical protein